MRVDSSSLNMSSNTFSRNLSNSPRINTQRTYVNWNLHKSIPLYIPSFRPELPIKYTSTSKANPTNVTQPFWYHVSFELNSTFVFSYSFGFHRYCNCIRMQISGFIASRHCQIAIAKNEDSALRCSQPQKQVDFSCDYLSVNKAVNAAVWPESWSLWSKKYLSDTNQNGSSDSAKLWLLAFWMTDETQNPMQTATTTRKKSFSS